MARVELVAWYPTWTRERTVERVWADRISGKPWGLPQERWPICGVCGEPLAFIGQLGHDAKRFRLTPGRVLYAFLCKNPKTELKCGLSAGVPGNEDGAHAVVIVPVNARPEGPTEPPRELPHAAKPGLVALSWMREVDTCPSEEVRDALLYGLHSTRPHWPEETGSDDLPKRIGTTKIGGRPVWIQDPWFQSDRADGTRWRYVAQWSDAVEVDGKRVYTTLEVGRLYLIERTTSGRFDLVYFAR